MNQTRQKEKEGECTPPNSAIVKSLDNHKESPLNDSTSKRAHQDYMINKKPQIERILREEEE